MPSAVELSNVTKRYGLITALRGLTLRVEQGNAVAVLGPNGSGKTTLLRIIAGQITPTSGQVSVLGLDPTRNLEEVKRRVGIVSHRSFLYDELTVEENLRFYGGFQDADRERLERAIEVANLQRWRNMSARHLSFGLRKRADIARAMLGSPQILVLDELFSGLDEETCRTLVEHLERSEGQTLLISSHSLEWLGKLCDRRVILNGGMMVSDGAL